MACFTQHSLIRECGCGVFSCARVFWNYYTVATLSFLEIQNTTQFDSVARKSIKDTQC